MTEYEQELDRRANAARGVAPIHPAMLRRIMDVEHNRPDAWRVYQAHAARCPTCDTLGHICRPCRASRYRGGQALLVVLYGAIALALVAIGFALAVTSNG